MEAKKCRRLRGVYLALPSNSTTLVERHADPYGPMWRANQQGIRPDPHSLTVRDGGRDDRLYDWTTAVSALPY
ncbi:hypothetical protein GCM10010345_77600 [Streptomyces canarius]|uniref:Uncharacterized protein n=1 Tax=Streptomyces canarius TaxID=285453 RepID=A0ABQ3D708_9ACTN|nr:hypothetical protein GCM10010345_77600 [Streptomyces canarius]